MRELHIDSANAGNNERDIRGRTHASELRVEAEGNKQPDPT